VGADRTLRLAVHDGIEPRRELANLASHLAAAATSPDAPPTLIVSRLTGVALAYGRFQRPTPPGPDAPVRVRRHSAGAACAYGEGQVSVCLVVPDLVAWADIPFLDKVVNRCVRGTIRALGSLGLRAVYGGRDHLVADGHRVAVVGMAAAGEGGPCLFQAILGHTAPPVLALPGGPADVGPPWSCLDALRPGLEFSSLASALADAYGAGRTVEAAPAVPEGEALDPPSVPGDDFGTLWGDPEPVPIGTVSVGLRGTPDGTLSALVLGGELMVDDGAAAALTRALAGRPLDPETVQGAVQAVFADPARHAVLGVPDLGALGRAVLATVNHWRNAGNAVRV